MRKSITGGLEPWSLGVKSRALGVFIAATALSGCNHSKQYDGLANFEAAPSQQVHNSKSFPVKQTRDESKALALATESLSRHALVGSTAKLKSTNVSDNDIVGSIRRYRGTQKISSTLSAHCRRILAETGVETTILRSPSVVGTVNTDNDFNIGASYDLVDLTRANLKEELASARCKRDAISARLVQLLVTSSQSLTRAGFLAKSRALKNSGRTFAAINASISNGLNEGSLTRLRANTLHQHIQQVKFGEARARGEAAKREVVDRLLLMTFRDLDGRLVAAEQHMQALSARARTADAVKVKASVNYARGSVDGAFLSSDSDGDVSAKLTVSVRLGAFSPRRYALEDVVSEARVASLYEQDRGVLWRTQALADANNRVLHSFKQQRKNVVNALARAKSNSKNNVTEFQPELLMSQLRARVDVLSLQAELAGLDATIADTKRIDAKLNFRQ